MPNKVNEMLRITILSGHDTSTDGNVYRFRSREGRTGGNKLTISIDSQNMVAGGTIRVYVLLTPGDTTYTATLASINVGAGTSPKYINTFDLNGNYDVIIFNNTDTTIQCQLCG